MDVLDRRHFGEGFVALATLIAIGAFDAHAARQLTADHDMSNMSNMPASCTDDEKIGFLSYPQFVDLPIFTSTRLPSRC